MVQEQHLPESQSQEFSPKSPRHFNRTAIKSEKRRLTDVSTSSLQAIRDRRSMTLSPRNLSPRNMTEKYGEEVSQTHPLWTPQPRSKAGMINGHTADAQSVPCAYLSLRLSPFQDGAQRFFLLNNESNDISPVVSNVATSADLPAAERATELELLYRSGSMDIEIIDSGLDSDLSSMTSPWLQSVWSLDKTSGTETSNSTLPKMTKDLSAVECVHQLLRGKLTAQRGSCVSSLSSLS